MGKQASVSLDEFRRGERDRTSAVSPSAHSTETCPVLSVLTEPSIEWRPGETDRKIDSVATRPRALGGSGCYRGKVGRGRPGAAAGAALHGGQGRSRRGDCEIDGGRG